MGCFLGCFRIKDRQTPNAYLFSDAYTSKNKGHLLSCTQLANLLYGPEEQDSDHSPCAVRELSSPCGNFAYLSPESKGADEHEINDDMDLKKEVKFLKSCGTLLNTPTELQKPTEAGNKKNVNYQDASFEIHSSVVSWGEVWCGKQDGVNLCEESIMSEAITSLSYPLCTSVKLEGMAKCSNNHHNDDDHPQEPKDVFVPSKVLITDLGNIEDCSFSNGCKQSDNALKNKKCVHFESIPKKTSESWGRKSESSVLIDRENQVGQKLSPYPTPLKVTEEMQTPGTVYTHPENFINQNGRIRSQFVHPVSRSVEDLVWQEATKEHIVTEHVENYSYDVLAKASIESSIKNKRMLWKPLVLESCGSSDDVNVDKVSEKTLSIDSSLSNWLKSPYIKDVKSGKVISTSNRSSGFDLERPIIGMVAAHWNDDQLIISPKGWDGNGIPNSTSKYKEDQKVRWHATPFEKRLKKALSDEVFCPHRGHLFGINENELDTAASQC